MSSSTDSGRPLIMPRGDTVVSSISDRKLIAELSIKSIYSNGLLNFLFGSGTLVTETDLVLPSSGSASKFVPHNAFISFTQAYGFVSLACFLAIIARSLLKSWRTQKMNNMVPFLPVWVSSLFIDLQWTFIFMTLLISLASLKNTEYFPPYNFQKTKGE
jgi:hypothetical protein